ncbi:hypothetical protein [Prochlorococcus sp. MIT 1223]|uniref:hypothetical protein n=1 Tax=Prochlorococcus sp. MIT 1223 TaxID=3096217 RepID=UPI002A74A445|nr:hypothetical protein [Prochlorococcus sp. MIT 1223]
MPICVVVFKGIEEANGLITELQGTSESPLKVQLVRPSSFGEKEFNQMEGLGKEIKSAVKIFDIDSVKLLSPKLAKKLRQKTMAFWLMPFGLITGLAFTKMTGLKTFSQFGFDPIAEPLIGSLLGMGSGWIGSYVASGSVNPEINDDIQTLRKTSKEGKYLLLLETPLEFELPWKLIKDSNNLKIISLNDI